MSERENQSPVTDKIREDIHRHAAAYAEAMVYSMNNSYLTNVQKAYVESLYQLPLGVFSYSLLAMLAFGKPGNYLEAFLVAAFVSLCFAVTVWVETNMTWVKIGFIFVGPAATIINLALAGYLGYQGNWIGVGIGIAAALGFLALIAPSTYVYTILSRGMHPKYTLAKKLFGIRFPFEDILLERKDSNG